jgi:hypothetical protein
MGEHQQRPTVLPEDTVAAVHGSILQGLSELPENDEQRGNGKVLLAVCESHETLRQQNAWLRRKSNGKDAAEPPLPRVCLHEPLETRCRYWPGEWVRVSSSFGLKPVRGLRVQIISASQTLCRLLGPHRFEELYKRAPEVTERYHVSPCYWVEHARSLSGEPWSAPPGTPWEKIPLMLWAPEEGLEPLVQLA